MIIDALIGYGPGGIDVDESVSPTETPRRRKTPPPLFPPPADHGTGLSPARSPASRASWRPAFSIIRARRMPKSSTINPPTSRTCAWVTEGNAGLLIVGTWCRLTIPDLRVAAHADNELPQSRWLRTAASTGPEARRDP